MLMFKMKFVEKIIYILWIEIVINLRNMYNLLGIIIDWRYKLKRYVLFIRYNYRLVVFLIE